MIMHNTIMNVSLQALVDDLRTTVSSVQSATSLNAMMMMATFVLFGGTFADVLGMKRTFMTGVVVYIVGSLPASVNNNLPVFILGWCVIHGFSAALMQPNVQTIIRAVLSGEARSRAYGTMAGVNALGAIADPLIGGFLTTYSSWCWAFRLEVLTLLVIVVLHRVIPKDQPDPIPQRIDIVDTVLQAGAMISLVLGILLISDYGVLIARQPVAHSHRTQGLEKGTMQSKSTHGHNTCLKSEDDEPRFTITDAGLRALREAEAFGTSWLLHPQSSARQLLAGRFSASHSRV